MKWLIAEDALKNRQGHWFEYIQTFRSGLAQLGHDATVLAEHNADSFIADLPDVQSVLPDSIWHRMSAPASRIQRYLRVPRHAMATRKVLRKWLAENPLPDIVFVPTVLVHHLLAWWRLYTEILADTPARLLLFFPNTPVQYDEDQQAPAFGRDPTSRLFLWLIRRMEKAVRDGRVILGVETFAMRDAMTEVTGVPFTYLPHPVTPGNRAAPRPAGGPLHFGCYGAARHEKGSDILQEAIAQHINAHPDTRSHFHIQWIDPFVDSTGQTVDVDGTVSSDPRVEVIREFFPPGGYERQIQRTDVMLLPYREPYRYRVSRVVIEAMVASMPAVATDGTTLWEQISHFGSGVPCQLNDAASLAAAIRRVELDFDALQEKAIQSTDRVRHHFSVAGFVELIQSELGNR